MKINFFAGENFTAYGKKFLSLREGVLLLTGDGDAIYCIMRCRRRSDTAHIGTDTMEMVLRCGEYGAAIWSMSGKSLIFAVGKCGEIVSFGQMMVCRVE